MVRVNATACKQHNNHRNQADRNSLITAFKNFDDNSNMRSLYTLSTHHNYVYMPDKTYKVRIYFTPYIRSIPHFERHERRTTIV